MGCLWGFGLMLDEQQLAAFAPIVRGQRLIAGCVVRRETKARHSAVVTRRVMVAIVALVALPLALFVLAKLGILWIGALFTIGPVIAFAHRTTKGLTVEPKVFHAILTEHSLLLVDAEPQDAGLTVSHALPRSTLSDVRANGGRIVMTSAGVPIKLLADASDAQQLSTLLTV
jgi:hypothetical protein